MAGTTRRHEIVESQTRAVVELDLTINYTTGNAPTVEAENECVRITRTGAGAITIQLLQAGGADMKPGYAKLLNKHFSWSNSLTSDVRWGNYDQANGTLAFTTHVDKAAATVAADPANSANTNLSITLRFKNSDRKKF